MELREQLLEGVQAVDLLSPHLTGLSSFDAAVAEMAAFEVLVAHPTRPRPRGLSDPADRQEARGRGCATGRDPWRADLYGQTLKRRERSGTDRQVA